MSWWLYLGYNRNQEMLLARRNCGLDAGRVTSPEAMRHPGRNTEMNHNRNMVGRDQVRSLTQFYIVRIVKMIWHRISFSAS